MQLDKIDKIIIQRSEEVNSLLRWRDLNRDLVREFKPTLKEGIIEFQQVRIYFKQMDKIIEYKIWFGDTNVMSFVVDLVEEGYRVIKMVTEFPKEETESHRMDAVTIHASLMAYMAHYERHVTKRTVRTSKTKKGKGGSKSKSKIVKIGRAIYDVKVPTEVRTEKRPYTPATEPFEVRGHERVYKSGKKVWIESYTKGDKTKEKSPKTYKL
ncbi:hypothetical protein MKY96_32500 [Paenibacillus sp. FSL R7-0302]|uniref:hypothetical protein n=1 Tax=Paenibacillus sp. FSL R7-0302 TaxID=2921681 RepID=UPI0030FC5378